MAATLVFEELLEELRDEIARHFLDIPTRLSLSLTSKEMRKRYFNLTTWNNWQFLEDCIKYGYFDLLQYAWRLGSLVEYRELVFAIEYNRTAMVAWVCAVELIGTDLPDNCLEYLCELASGHGNLDIMNTLNYQRLGSENELAIFAAKGGHLEIVKVLLPDCSSASVALCEAAARGGHLSDAFALCADPASPTADEVSAMFRGGLYGGHLAIVLEAEKRGAELKAAGIVYAEVSLSLDILSYLIEHGVDLRDLDSNFLARRVLKGRVTLPHIDLLLHSGVRAEDLSLRELFERNTKDEDGSIFLTPLKPEEKQERFSCIKTLFDLGMSLPSGFSPSLVAGWDSLEIMKFVIGKSKGPIDKNALDDAGFKHFNDSLEADVRLTRYLSELGADFTTKTLHQAIFLFNNIDVLDVLYELYQDKPLFRERKGDAAFWTNLKEDAVAIFRNNATIIAWPKSRIRINNFLHVLEWFAQRDLISRESLELFGKALPHRFFQRRLEALLDRMLD